VRKESFSNPRRRKKMTFGDLKKFCEVEGIADDAEIESSDGHRVVGGYSSCRTGDGILNMVCLYLVPDKDRDHEFFEHACDIYRRSGRESTKADPAHSHWCADGGYELGSVGGALAVFNYDASDDLLELGYPGLMD
jgi:hypothetical protein